MNKNADLNNGNSKMNKIYYHFWCNLSHRGCNRFACATIICHLKLNRVSYLQMFSIATKLAKVKKQASLPLTALNKSIGVKKFLNNACLSNRWVIHWIILLRWRIVSRAWRGINRVSHRAAVNIVTKRESISTTHLRLTVVSIPWWTWIVTFKQNKVKVNKYACKLWLSFMELCWEF